MKTIEPNAFYRTHEVGLISSSRLATMRTEGTGPRFVKRGSLIFYRGSDLIAYFEAGAAQSVHEADLKNRRAYQQSAA